MKLSLLEYLCIQNYAVLLCYHLIMQETLAAFYPSKHPPKQVI